MQFNAHSSSTIIPQNFISARRILSGGCVAGLFGLLVLISCARQGVPSGGPKDTQPPQVDSLGSTPNFSTRFDKKRIELKFDEWVVLSDVLTQVVVSPPLAKRPEVVLKGKTVVLTFDKAEVLYPNTTYTVNFGNSVKDLHEGNSAKDLRFVFSTGDFIDSLTFKGILTDAFTGEPVENISVLLYENFADSAVRKERPYYFSRTDKSGLYSFQNLRAGRYRVVALEDSDLNLRWDGELERIGFRDSALVVNDSLGGTVNFKLFKNQPKFLLVGLNTDRFGLVKVGFNTPVDAFEIQTLAPAGLKTLVEKTPDSLLVWYDLPQDTAWSLLFTSPELRARNEESAAFGLIRSEFDTVSVKKLSRTDFLSRHRLDFGDIAVPAPTRGRGQPAPAKAPSVKTIVQTASKPVQLGFNYPVTSFDTARWIITVDSSRLSDYQVRSDSISPRRLSCSAAWKEGNTYKFTFLPGALIDFWGAPNTDTLFRIFNVVTGKQLGTLSMTVENLRPGTPYVLQLLNGKNLEEERVFVAETEAKVLVFSDLQVAGYSARLVEDLNGNGRWDSGSFNEKRQPEQVFNKKFDPLRANWELKVTFPIESSLKQKGRGGKE